VWVAPVWVAPAPGWPFPNLMNEARLSHLPFWGPSEGFFLINLTAVGLTRMNRFETFEFWVKGSGKPLS